MENTTTTATEWRPFRALFDALFPIFAFLVGAVASEVNDPGDRASIVKTGLAMLFAAAWQVFAFSYIGHIAMGYKAEIRPEIIAFAVLGAVFIIIIDSLLFMEPSFVRQGYAELRRGGLKVAKSFGDVLEGILLLLARIVLAVAIVQLTAFALISLFFGPDIKAMLASDYRAKNAAIIAQADNAYNAAKANKETALAKAQQAREDVGQQEIAFRQTAVDPSASDSEILHLREQVTAAEEAFREADAKLSDAETFAANELAGISAPGNSGKAGRGPVRMAAEERVEAARARSQDAKAVLDAARNALSGAQALASRKAYERQAAASGSLSLLTAQRTQLDVDVKSREADYQAFIANRDQWIEAYITASPTYVAPETGLMAIAGTFPRLAEDEAKFSLMVIFEIVFFLVEMGAILSRSGTLTPSPYARQKAYDGYLGAVTAARKLSDAVDDISSRPRREQSDDRSARQAGNDNAGDLDDADTEGTVISPLMSFFDSLGARPKRGRPKGSKTKRIGDNSVPPFFLPPPRKQG